MNAFLTILTGTTLLVISVVVLVAGGMAIVPKFAQRQGLEDRRNELLRQIDHSSHEIKVLKDKQQRFKTDPEFVEHTARLNKRVRPGELVFIFASDPEPDK